MMKSVKTIGNSMREKIDNDIDKHRRELSGSILGTVTSAHLDLQKYNLNPLYIVDQKVKEYKSEREKPYS